ncbi:MAG: hypothetical protein SNI12_04470 [Rikenellaceae bacterium]
MSRFNIIWIDDEWQKQSSFIEECKVIHGIDITPFTTSKDGMNALEGNLYHWHGVILDAKVFNESENEVAKLTGLQNSIKRIEALSSRRVTPYFISTGQPDLLSNELFGDQFGSFYRKGTDDAKLITGIKDAANRLPETNVKNRYSDVLSISSEIYGELMTLLLAIENSVTNEPNYLNSIRKILEWLRGKFQDLELLPQSVTELNGFSRYVCENLAPISIQRSLHSAIVVSQEGSHRLTIDEEIRSGLAPYLLRSTSFELLNVLLWSERLFADNTEIERIKQLAIDKNAANHSEDEQPQTSDKVIHYEGVVVKDDNNNICCGEYLLSFKCEHLVGKSIQIIERSENTNYRTKHLYRHFARKYEIK